MMGNKARDFQMLPRVSLESLVPADHFYRHLHTALDLSFVRGLVSDLYSPIGRPGVDPVVFFKLQLVMFFEGIRSERQLMRMVQDRLSLRWYLGYDLHEPLPDHSSLTRIRERYGLDVFRRFFERVVELCREAGLVWGEELFFDATKVRANADLDSLEPRFYHNARRHVDALFADPPSQRVGVTSAEPTQGPPPGPSSAAGPPALAIQHSGEGSLELEAENRGRWRLLDECRLDPGRPPSGPYRRITDLRVSATDPDAAPMSDGRKPSLGYHDHYVVDGGKARVILGCLVTPGDVMENAPMLDLLWRVRFRWKLHPRCAVGDTTYGTGENIRAVEEDGIRAYVPLTDFEAGSPFYRHADFTYDPDDDVYTCPRGAILRPRGNCYTTRTRAYQAPREACASCPSRSRCTDSSQGRRLNRHFDEEYRERVRGYHQTEPYRRVMRKRKVWVEPLFGEAKDWHGLRRFRLRGLWKVNVEGLMVATGQNLKRLLSHTGWGRRPYPGGAEGRALSLPPLPPHPPW
jgi:transposase